MKYGESAFDIFYLLLAVICGCILLRRADSREQKIMGAAVLVLGCGDAFHLIPRVLNYFVNADFTAALGAGKLVTSITMTIFYLLLYDIWSEHYRKRKSRELTVLVWTLVIIRAVLCLFPQNRWLANSSDMTWGIIRNVPFVLLGAVICFLFFGTRHEDRMFANVWLYILLSFLFYIPVAVAAGIIPALGMLMLPKTICYILLIITFMRSAAKK